MRGPLLFSQQGYAAGDVLEGEYSCRIGESHRPAGDHKPELTHAVQSRTSALDKARGLLNKHGVKIGKRRLSIERALRRR